MVGTEDRSIGGANDVGHVLRVFLAHVFEDEVDEFLHLEDYVFGGHKEVMSILFTVGWWV